LRYKWVTGNGEEKLPGMRLKVRGETLF